jgi:alginate O-acetyltransferase complex protein AlgI
MVFASQIFLFGFLPIVFLLYAISTRMNIKSSNIVLLFCSLGFMFWGNGLDILILLAVIIINFIAGLVLNNIRQSEHKQTKKKLKERMVLTIAVILSLSFLAYYKYSFFIIDNSISLLNRFGLDLAVPDVIYNVMLPLGISFYTFQALSYTIDIYFKNASYTKSIFDFSLYVSFFPQLIAGPIVRYKDIYKQIQQRSTNIDRIFSGTLRFVEGFIKKVLLANAMAGVADSVFDMQLNNMHAGLAWVGAIAYSFQIYLDFSAYSDMAIGLAKIFGFDLLENFNFPYKAKTIQDFWRRWHISLSSWFRDYVYIPLGGNRKGNKRTYVNLLIIFFVCGLWHGAAWTFVVWGLWHGMFLIFERRKFGELINRLPNFISRIYVLLMVIIGWVVFRSETLSFALSYLKIMFVPTQFNGVIWIKIRELLQNDVLIATVFAILSGFGILTWIKKKMYAVGKTLQNVYVGIAVILFVLSIFTLYSDGYNPFIYFRF